LEDGVRDPGRRIVYNGLVLFDLMITFFVVRSFTDTSNGSNSIEHQLLVVK
jgi:formate-dependent phosphoribosylglycinamide formyltransferase (GAR transformylase)